MFNGIMDALQTELEDLDAKYRDSGNAMNNQDLEHIDKITHAMKCLATYEAMKNDGGRGRRERYGRDYSDGYDRRY